MRPVLIYLFLSGFIIFCTPGKSFAGPDSLLHKPFGVQFNGLLKIYHKLQGVDSATGINEIDGIVAWSKNKGDEEFTSLATIIQWRFYRDRGRNEDDYETKALAMVSTAQKNGWDGVKAVMQRELAKYYSSVQHDEGKSLQYFISAYDIVSRMSASEYPDKCDFLYDLGSKYYHYRDYNTAKKYFLEAWKTVPLALVDNKISKMNSLALCYSYLEENDSAAWYFNIALDWAKKEKDNFWIGYVSGNLAVVYYNLGQFEKTIPLFNADIEYSLQAHETGGAARSMGQLSEVYLRLGDQKTALQYARKTYSLICENKLNDDIGTVKSAYPYLARVYAASGQHAIAYGFLDSGARMNDSFIRSRNQLLLAGAQQKVEVEKHLGEIRLKEGELHRQKVFRNMWMAGVAVLVLFSFLLFTQKRRINKEKDISDDLLRNILPSETAEELKRTGTAVAKNYNSVTVLFTDFKNFTEVSSKMTAQQLVQEINYYYSEFDKIITKYNLEKIKTIGDSYMCAGGLPVESKTHAEDVIFAAMDMVRFLDKERKDREAAGRSFLEMRIGVNTGPVVAGIVGIKKFTYDIWGDTVNIASRMESSGVEGRINISETTYQIIKDRFRCTYRGEVEVKSRGMMKMYFVEEPTAPLTFSKKHTAEFV